MTITSIRMAGKQITHATAYVIALNILDVTCLLRVGFIGSLASGVTGSGGAFVLTPAIHCTGA